MSYIDPPISLTEALEAVQDTQNALSSADIALAAAEQRLRVAEEVRQVASNDVRTAVKRANAALNAAIEVLTLTKRVAVTSGVINAGYIHTVAI